MVMIGEAGTEVPAYRFLDSTVPATVGSGDDYYSGSFFRLSERVFSQLPMNSTQFNGEPLFQRSTKIGLPRLAKRRVSSPRTGLR